jgi:hypothetical protein
MEYAKLYTRNEHEWAMYVCVCALVVDTSSYLIDKKANHAWCYHAARMLLMQMLHQPKRYDYHTILYASLHLISLPCIVRLRRLLSVS